MESPDFQEGFSPLKAHKLNYKFTMIRSNTETHLPNLTGDIYKNLECPLLFPIEKYNYTTHRICQLIDCIISYEGEK